MKKTGNSTKPSPRMSGVREIKALSRSDRERLHEWFLFHEVAPDVLEEWTLSKRARVFQAGEVIYSEERFARAIGFVLEGEVLVKKGQTELNRIREGQCFGAAAVFCETPEYVTCIEAKRRSRVLFFTASELTDLFKVYPEAAIAFMTFLSGRVQFLNRKIEAYTQTQTQDVLWTYLLRHQNPSGEVAVEGGMARLSRELSISRASLYRSLDKLEQEGKITRSKSLIHIV